MSKHLAELLDQPKTLVEMVVTKLENLSSFSSTDIKVLSEMNNIVRAKTADLGLDPDDTSPKELYHSLITKLVNDERKISQQFSLDSTDHVTFAQRVATLMEESNVLPEVYALKRSVAKDLIKNHPPRKLMKMLNCRSVDSLIKRENASILLAASLSVESERWINTFWHNLSRVKASDFENRLSEIVIASSKYQKILNNQADVVRSVPQLGAVVIWPTEKNQKLGAIGLCLILTQNISALRLHSIITKINTMESNFGKSYVNSLQNGHKTPLKLIHMPISWKTVFHGFGKDLQDEYAELFGPHIVQADLHLPRPSQMLAKVFPHLEWWTDTDHAAKKHSVSLNIMDVLANHLNGRSYKQRISTHFQHSLWHELIDRYLDHPNVKAFLSGQLMGEQNLNLEFAPVSDKMTVNEYARTT